MHGLGNDFIVFDAPASGTPGADWLRRAGDRHTGIGFDRNERYPDAPEVPRTVLVNPTIVPLGDAMEEGWEGCLSVPGLRGAVPRHARIRYTGADPLGATIEREAEGFHARVVQQ